jgi:hypothetical protein
VIWIIFGLAVAAAIALTARRRRATLATASPAPTHALAERDDEFNPLSVASPLHPLHAFSASSAATEIESVSEPRLDETGRLPPPPRPSS